MVVRSNTLDAPRNLYDRTVSERNHKRLPDCSVPCSYCDLQETPHSFRLLACLCVVFTTTVEISGLQVALDNCKSSSETHILRVCQFFGDSTLLAGRVRRLPCVDEPTCSYDKCRLLGRLVLSRHPSLVLPRCTRAWKHDAFRGWRYCAGHSARPLDVRFCEVSDQADSEPDSEARSSRNNSCALRCQSSTVNSIVPRNDTICRLCSLHLHTEPLACTSLISEP